MKWFICMNCDAQMPMTGGYFEGRALICRQCKTLHAVKQDCSHQYIEIFKEEDPKCNEQ